MVITLHHQVDTCSVNVFSRKRNWHSSLMSQSIWVASIEARWCYS